MTFSAPNATDLDALHNWAWWGIEHECDGIKREYPTLHWAEEPEQGAGPRRAFECDACGERYAFYEERPQ